MIGLEYNFTDEEKAEAQKQWKIKNDKIRHICRYRPEGQCFRCGQIKPELMEDPLNPAKIYNEMWSNCNECEAKIDKKYKELGKWP